MKTFREVLADVDARHVAIGHFNISELAALKGIFSAAQELTASYGAQMPILIGVSEGEREFIGVRQAAALVRSLREEYDYPIFLNADHTHSFEKAIEAANAGFDEVLFDGSGLVMEENIAETKKVVAAIRAIDPAIVIEGEIGYIGTSSEVIAEKPVNLALSTAEEAVRFMRETGIDVLAPAVGNMHGLLKTMVAGTEKKRLNIARIAEIKQAIVALPVNATGGGHWCRRADQAAARTAAMPTTVTAPKTTPALSAVVSMPKPGKFGRCW